MCLDDEGGRIVLVGVVYKIYINIKFLIQNSSQYNKTYRI